MPIFNNELIDNVRGDGSLEGPDPVLGSIEGTKLDIGPISAGAMFVPSSKKGFSLEELKQIVAEKMETAVNLSVVLKVNMGTGQNWYDLK
jgi:hypothetical protein